MYVKNILFDLDGTLVDNFTAIYKTYAHVQRELGLPEASYEKVKRTVGGSVPVTIRRLIGENCAEEATKLFEETFPQYMLDGLTLLHGARDLAKFLHENGKTVAVFTNKTGNPAREICHHLGLTPYLAKVIGTGDTPYRKPQKEFSEHMLRSLDAKAEETILIGDSPFDIEAGKVVGLRSYVVATGSHTYEQLQSSDPAADGVYHDMPDLGQKLFNFDAAPGGDAPNT